MIVGVYIELLLLLGRSRVTELSFAQGRIIFCFQLTLTQMMIEDVAGKNRVTELSWILLELRQWMIIEDAADAGGSHWAEIISWSGWELLGSVMWSTQVHRQKSSVWYIHLLHVQLEIMLWCNMLDHDYTSLLVSPYHSGSICQPQPKLLQILRRQCCLQSHILNVWWSIIIVFGNNGAERMKGCQEKEWQWKPNPVEFSYHPTPRYIAANGWMVLSR